MPSDERTTKALAAIAPARETFRTAVAGAVDEVRALLARQESRESRERQTLELGAFASGRIDADRFGALFARGEAIDASALAAATRSLVVLEEIAAWTEDDFVVRLGPDDDLRDRAADALANAGRAFGAARAVELARTHRYRTDEDDRLTAAFPPTEWNRAERQIAPPLVIELPGALLRGCALSEFLEGTQKLVLIVAAPAPPAPLVRLISPNMLVAQVAPTDELTDLLTYDGPAVVVVMPEGAARFVHDPRRHGTLTDRLTIEHMPADEPRGVLGGLSAQHRREDLLQLRALCDAAAAAAVPAGAAAEAAVVKTAGPADHLAAWLLRQADMSGL